MDQIQAILSRLPPEQQDAAREYLVAHPEALPAMEPELSDEQLGNVTASRRGDTDIERQRARVEQALAAKQGGENELMAGISGPKYVPSRWGPIAVRQSPLMNVVKAIRAYQGGRQAKQADQDLTGLYDKAQSQLGGYLGATRDVNKSANAQRTQSAAERIAAILSGQMGAP